MTIEEHGAGRQFVRVRVWPQASRAGLAAAGLAVGVAAAGLAEGHWAPALLLGGAGVLIGLRAALACAAGTEAVLHALKD
jgi:hypothetical protein